MVVVSRAYQARFDRYDVLAARDPIMLVALQFLTIGVIFVVK
jgi:hypothetical protein